MNIMMARSAFLSVLLSLAVLVVHAQSVDEVLTNYFKNTGGLKAWKKLKTVTMQGEYPSPQGSFVFTIYKKSPNMIKLVVDVNGHDIIPQAYDGETAWTLNPMMGSDGPQRLPETVAREVAANAEFQDAFIDYKKKGHEASYEGTEEINGVNTYVLKLERNKNNGKAAFTEFHYFDTENYLPIMIKIMASSGQESLTYLSDYQKTNGKLIMPFVVESKIDGKTISKIMFEKIMLNKKIKDDVFTFPKK